MPPAISFDPGETPGEIFGANVFTKAVMQTRLPKSVYKSIMATIEQGRQARPGRRRRRRRGDEGLGDGEGRHALRPRLLPADRPHRREARQLPRARSATAATLAEFAGKTLIQGEPDASSFPIGGLRTTFEARGYTGWDATSPAYILENPNGNTLCIPTVFVSMTGEALDHKTPLLRSPAGDGQARRAGPEAVRPREPRPRRVVLRPRAGVLPDRPALLPGPPRPAQRRPHAVRRQAAEGPGVRRPLLRRDPRAGPRLHDGHRARAVQARHPGQDPAQRGGPRPVRARADVRAGQRRRRPPAAADDDLQDDRQEARHGMPVPREAVRRRQRLRASTSTSRSATPSEGNLLLPGDTPHENAQFLVFCAAVIRAVHKYGGLLRASVASATNDHRLGANEAPPAIISIFLGDQLADVFDQIAKGGGDLVQGQGHADDRRRHAAARCRPTRATATAPARSPSPATGSSSGRRARCSRSPARWSRSTRSWPRRSTTSPPSWRRPSPTATDFNTAVQKLLTEIITDHGDVVFNGDGYSDELADRGGRRGPAEPEDHARRPARADQARGDGAVREVRRVQPARDAQPLRDRPRAVRADHRRRGQARRWRSARRHPAGRRSATRPSWRRTSPR